MPTVNIIMIEDEALRACNVAKFEQLFANLTPDQAMLLRGRNGLGSAWCDRDPRSNWHIPEWRRYMARLFERLPHFSYFLFAAGPVYVSVVLALIAEKDFIKVNEHQEGPDGTALVKKLVSLLEPVVAYCKDIGDEPEPVLNNLLQGFPAVRDEVLEDLSFEVR